MGNKVSGAEPWENLDSFEGIVCQTDAWLNLKENPSLNLSKYILVKLWMGKSGHMVHVI